MTASGDRELRVFEVQPCDVQVHVQTACLPVLTRTGVGERNYFLFDRLLHMWVKRESRQWVRKRRAESLAER